MTSLIRLLFIVHLFISYSSSAFHTEFAIRQFQELSFQEFSFQPAQHGTRHKRDNSIKDLNLDSNRLTFHAYNRTFNLILKRGLNLLSDKFQLEVRYTNPNHTTHANYEDIKNLERNYFTGFVEDEASSSALVYYESKENVHSSEKPLIYVQIRIRNIKNNSVDYYYVEPTRTTNTSAPKYVVYKSADVESSILTGGIFNSTVCNAKHIDQINDLIELSNHKVKRNVIDFKKKKKCSLALVADHKFFKNVGNSNVKQTQTYLTNIIARVNDIYTSTEWYLEEDVPVNDRRNFGFVIDKIVIFAQEHTNETNHYNREDSSKNSDTILEMFSRSEDWTPYCLAHLFTFQEFDRNVLGLAYVASPAMNSVGGVCSDVAKGYSPRLSVNTGLSSYMSTSFAQRRLTQREAELVTAHEFGHNWGAEHDSTGPCIPRSGPEGGNYLMFPYANAGLERNNILFSSCSITSISEVLKTKSTCFKEETYKLCGNNRIDEGEDCDGGERGLMGLDSCCDSKCKFKPGAECSDDNHDCCNNCKIARKGSRCVSNKNYLECFQDYSTCDGVSKMCSEYQPLPANTPCLSFDKGKCDGLGHCLSLCQQGSFKYDPCLCSKSEYKCMICCRIILKDTNETDCRPYHQIRASEPEYLSRGRACIDGMCDEKQVCVHKVKDYVSRFWKVIQKMDVNSFVEFMRRNIVGSIILISLFLWVPISCCIHFCIDKRENAEQEQKLREKIRTHNQMSAQLRENENLIIS